MMRWPNWSKNPMTPTKQDELAYSDYEKSRIELCEINKDDINALNLIAHMDGYVQELRENWYNLDPDGIL